MVQIARRGPADLQNAFSRPGRFPPPLRVSSERYLVPERAQVKVSAVDAGPSDCWPRYVETS